MTNEEIEKIIRDYLPQLVHMSLATSKDNRPWVCEVHFVYDENLNLYFRSLATTRHGQEIAENPYVAGNIVKQHELGQPVLGVYFEGTAKQLEAGSELDEAVQCFKDRFKMEVAEEAVQPDGHKLYKISVENFYIFGRFDGPSGQKYQLAWNGGKK